MAILNSVSTWLAILLSGLVSALLAAFFTHWIERRKEQIATFDRALAYLSLIEIDMSLNEAKSKGDNTSVSVNGAHRHIVNYTMNMPPLPGFGLYLPSGTQC